MNRTFVFFLIASAWIVTLAPAGHSKVVPGSFRIVVYGTEAK
jgi:hypothetical protein